MKNKWNKNILQLGVMLALAGCACILFAEVIKQWKSIFGFFGNVVSAMTPIIIGLVIAFMLNPIMIYIRRGLSFLICKIKKEEPIAKHIIYFYNKIKNKNISLDQLYTIIDNLQSDIQGETI